MQIPQPHKFDWFTIFIYCLNNNLNNRLSQKKNYIKILKLHINFDELPTSAVLFQRIISVFDHQKIFSVENCRVGVKVICLILIIYIHIVPYQNYTISLNLNNTIDYVTWHTFFGIRIFSLGILATTNDTQKIKFFFVIKKQTLCSAQFSSLWQLSNYLVVFGIN